VRRFAVFGFDDVQTVRVTCPHCRSVFEFPLEKAQERLGEGSKCLSCQTKLQPLRENHLADFFKAVRFVRGGEKPLVVEFVVRDDTGEKQPRADRQDGD
jgi:hypothetical protein